MENEIDIFGVTDTFRQCRQAIIQTKDQYFYAYKAVRAVRLLNFAPDSVPTEFCWTLPPLTQSSAGILHAGVACLLHRGAVVNCGC